MNTITFYQFLELPYLRQKLIYNQIRKSTGSFSEWQTQLIEVCKSGKIEKLKFLALKPFCERYISDLKQNELPIKKESKSVSKSSKIKNVCKFLIENKIPDRYANLFTEINIFDFKKMSFDDLVAINGIGKSTAKKIYEIILDITYNDEPI
tara:strand:- start:1808 stop:2260 length:453 start_codon:yes stop_codon:yes gene_type:complete